MEGPAQVAGHVNGVGIREQEPFSPCFAGGGPDSIGFSCPNGRVVGTATRCGRLVKDRERYASALADAYRLAMETLRCIALFSGFVMVGCVVSRWEDGPDRLTGPLFVVCGVVFVLSMGLLVLGLGPIRRFLRSPNP